MELRDLCNVCRCLNLKPETFLQTGWRYPTSLHYESLTESLDSSDGGTSSQRSHYVPGEKLEDVLWPLNHDRSFDEDVAGLPLTTHLSADEIGNRLNTKLSAPLLRHIFGEEGDPEWTVPVKSAKLGLLREVSRRADDGCSLCQLVVHASRLMTADVTTSKEITSDSVCRIRFDFRDVEAEAGSDTEHEEPVDTSGSSQGPETPFEHNSISQAQSNGYYECSILCGSSSVDVRPIFPANSDFAWFGGRQIGPVVNYLLVKQWLLNCDALHPRCSQESDGLDLESVGQLRVIDVEQNCLVEIVVPGPPFLALSYVWGDVPTLKLTEHNLLDLQQPGALSTRSSQIPETIRDTFQVAHQLGLRYVWVDSLCILQNELPEMTPELRKMDLIYAAAYLTVVAADGLDAGVGLLGSTAERPRDVPYITKHDDSLSLMLDTKPLHTVLNECPWTRRLWTLQEALMSRRLLVFTEQGVHFTCSSLSWSENSKVLSETTAPPWDHVAENAYYFRSQITDKNSVSSSAAGGFWGMELWLTTIMDASERKLKYEWDVENATAGLIIQLEMCYHTASCYGLPEAALAESLLWSPMDSGRLLRRRPKPGGEPYPTWTWMGWVGEISWLGGYVQDVGSPTENFDDFEISKMCTIDGASEPLHLPGTYRPRSQHNTYRYLRLITREIRLRVQQRSKALQHIQELQIYAWAVVPSDGTTKTGVHVVSMSTASGDHEQVGSVVFDSVVDYPNEVDLDYLFVQIGAKPQTVDVGDYAGQPFFNVLAVKQILMLDGGEVLAERIGHGRVLAEKVRGKWEHTRTILR